MKKIRAAVVGYGNIGHYAIQALEAADAALMMQLGSEGVFVGSGIFKSGDPAKRARAIVQAVTYYNDPVKLAELSENLGEAMSGLEIKTLENKYAERGW